MSDKATLHDQTTAMTGIVFGDLYEEKVSVHLSVLLPVLPTLPHISAQKTASVSTLTRQVNVSFHYCVVVVTVLKTITATVSPPDQHFSLRQCPVS